MLIFNTYWILLALAGTGLVLVRRGDRLRERSGLVRLTFGSGSRSDFRVYCHTRSPLAASMAGRPEAGGPAVRTPRA